MKPIVDECVRGMGHRVSELRNSELVKCRLRDPSLAQPVLTLTRQQPISK